MATTAPTDPRGADAIWHTTRVLLEKIDSSRAEQDALLRQANTLHTQLHETRTSDPAKWAPLVDLYKDTLTKCRAEINFIQQAETKLTALYAVLYPPAAAGSTPLAETQIKTAGSTASLPSSVSTSTAPMPGMPDPKIKYPPLPLNVGGHVIVRTQVEESFAWIWAKIVAVRGAQYEVHDLDPSAEQRIYHVTERELIPIVPPTYPEFPAGTRVMACFPGTTAFYPATVAVPPKQSAKTMYELVFDDDDNQVREVSTSEVAEYVVSKIDR